MTGATGRDASADPMSVLRSPRFIVVLVLAAVAGVVASFAAWCFLELIREGEHWLYKGLPHTFGYHGTPRWWSIPVLVVVGLLVALAITRLPGHGGGAPADGLQLGETMPAELPGVALAGLASIAGGAVVGPEAPLIALGGGLGLLMMRLIRRSAAPEEVSTLVASSAMFAAISFLFGSPLIAAVLVIEAAGLAGPRLSLVLIPGLLAAGLGSLVSAGMDALTGARAGDIELGQLPLPQFQVPTLVDFLWTIPLAVAIALLVYVVFRLAREVPSIVARRPMIALPLAGIVVAGLAIAFSYAAGKGPGDVLFSGQQTIGPLIKDTGSWSLAALALLIAFKGLAYAVSLGSFRGGPVFPALLLGIAAGLIAARLPGFSLTPAVAVGAGAAAASVMRLPLAGLLLATILTVHTGLLGAGPLIIVGVVAAYLVTLALAGRPAAEHAIPAPADQTPSPDAGRVTTEATRHHPDLPRGTGTD